MININDNFLKLPGSYLFSEIARRVSAYVAEHPDTKLIRLGIGDVTKPLVPAVVEALSKATAEMGDASTFRGYGPELGYDFLRSAILENDYLKRGVELGIEDIFISDGAKSDCGNIGDLFSSDNKVAVCDPVYPVYVDTNVMAGRAGEYKDGKWTEIIYMPCTEENGFSPQLPETVADMIYLCNPSNPTGTVMTRAQLKEWVDYANAHGSVILYDSAYMSYISQPDLPRSIYEIEGAKTCAIEFRSFSKTAGFTGTRCAYTVVPRELVRGGASLNTMWARRVSTKFNGVPYVIQRAAEAVYSPEGSAQCAQLVAYYMNNAQVIKAGLESAGLTVYGGENAPYIWVKTPNGMKSWDFFDKILNEANVVTTPGAGFGPSGEGFLRLTAFGDAEATKEAVKRITHIL